MSLEATSSVQSPAGWYPDPQGYGQRYWDGAAWTEHTAPHATANNGPAAASDGPVATRGDWIAGVLLSLFAPFIGFIAGTYYVLRGGERARCGWMCIGLSVAVFTVLFALDPFDYFRPEPGVYP